MQSMEKTGKRQFKKINYILNITRLKLLRFEVHSFRFSSDFFGSSLEFGNPLVRFVLREVLFELTILYAAFILAGFGGHAWTNVTSKSLS